MVAFSGVFLHSLLFLVALPQLSSATPVPVASSAGTRQRHAIAELLSFLCSIKPLNVLLCGSHSKGSQNDASVTITTPLGDASGVADTSSVGRFAVRYATAERWQESTMVSKWELPNGATDPSALPLACPQPQSDENSSNTDEDCLSMILYVPAIAATSKVPAMMWYVIHGGSLVIGSATGPGLDGAALAQATGSIIAVIQYRLGAFGFLSPNGKSNLAVKDTITALQFLQKTLPSFNGDTNRVTIAGQSSGATMVRALLATPSASNLFRGASLHSDPMNFGFLSKGAFQTLNNFLKSQLPCDSSDTACLNGLSTDDVLNVSQTVFGQAPSLDASTGAFMPMRPVTDHSLIASPLDATAPFPGQSKSIIVSTVRNEAGPTIFGMLTSPIPVSEFPVVVNASLGSARTSTVLNSQHYVLPPTNAANVSSVDTRPLIETIGTDQVWRCPSWTFSRLWAGAGGKVFVGEYAVGATYPDNEDIAFCTEGRKVCHEDDIKVVFNTVTSPSSAQKSLMAQVQARLKAFFATGSPAAYGFQNWNPVSSTNVNAMVLGDSGGLADIGACDPSFWGQAVQYDYQLFGI
ncbi:alpha/beta-hydrolase [Fomitiporia mediterranea MF3/22]|uniref:alpha/beta-hydrolase n=1 Tax=Fomitiporia mediterranea (strain MF3/22) TaxID=694068 RepID=UPI0004407937|nr:alpha/beta-hydrolase [Fomitiporia mediterranea MF3/22]EJD02246.1 alpha/beta-hydrolase [Fomitiporia mediterranea MF3/22]